ncbi:hypothetical protein V1478_007479, partial [Vespula squamosa]
VIGRQVAYHFLCDCVFNFKQVGPDTMRCNFHSGVEFSVSGYYAKFQQILISFNILCLLPYFADTLYRFSNLDFFYTPKCEELVLGSSIRINICWGIRVNIVGFDNISRFRFSRIRAPELAAIEMIYLYAFLKENTYI